ncbi:type II secretion system F family protein [Nonomuraea longicatena]|uniref:Type II secretion system protein GspF domain-containing protein n=1 Tax=Nonomuraea longicatena TaxID=83682 RepID=A0ABN1PUF1_9ACTN
MIGTVIATVAAASAVWLWMGPTTAHLRLARLTAQDHHRYRPDLRFLTRRRHAARQADAWHQATIDLCHALSAELTAGRTPGEALTRAVSSTDLPDPEALREVVAAARDGGDVAAALHKAAPDDAGEGLRRLAACWDLSLTAGAGLANLVERIGSTQRAARTHRLDVAAQLAGPRTTARMLAALPVLGLLMAGALSMNPLGFLLGTVPGAVCLTAGIALDVCGLWWTHRMALTAQNT